MVEATPALAVSFLSWVFSMARVLGLLAGADFAAAFAGCFVAAFAEVDFAARDFAERDGDFADLAAAVRAGFAFAGAFDGVFATDLAFTAVFFGAAFALAAFAVARLVIRGLQ